MSVCGVLARDSTKSSFAHDSKEKKTVGRRERREREREREREEPSNIQPNEWKRLKGNFTQSYSGIYRKEKVRACQLSESDIFMDIFKNCFFKELLL